MIGKASWVCLLAIATALLVAAPAGAAKLHPLIGEINGSAIGELETFDDACGVAVDSQGDFYVADYFHHRIVILNGERRYLTQVPGLGPPDGPCGLAVGGDGVLYVNEWNSDVVDYAPSEFPPTEATTYERGRVLDPAPSTGVAVDPVSGDVYVDDRSSVAVYEPSGEPVMREGEPLRIGAGSLREGYGVAVSGFAATAGWVYAADAADDTVKVYDPEVDPDDPVAVINGAGTPQAGFAGLRGAAVAVDPADGSLFVTDDLQPGFETAEAVVDEFSATNHSAGQLPPGVGPSRPSFVKFAEPSGLATSNGRIIVTSGNREGSRVLIFGSTAAPPTQLVDVAVGGSGAGVVSSSPAGLRCPGACEGEFDRNSTVVLSATPSPGSSFAGWSGCDSNPSPGSCAVTLGSDRSVGAEFTAVPQATLTASLSGTGGGVVTSAPAGISCGGACSATFDRGTRVLLTAAPDTGSAFAGWSGCEVQADGGCAVVLSADTEVGAAFSASPTPTPTPRPSSPGPPVASPSPPPGPGFHLGGLRRHGAVADLTVTVPSAGILTAAGKGLRSSRVASGAAGPVSLHLRLNRRGERELKRTKKRKLAVRLSLIFAPGDQSPFLRANRTVVFGAPHRR